MNRREFLAATTAATMVPCWTGASTAPVTLTAAKLTQQVVPPDLAGPTELLGFNGSVPGPELRITQGELLKVRVENGLDTGAAVHWHGIRLPNAMDGVPDLTQPLIAPGDSHEYSYTPPDAGTYWYHSHYLSHEQVARGLMGPLIVAERTPPDVDHDIVALLTDWRFTPEGALTEDFGNRHDIAHAGRMGNYARAYLPDITLKKGERVRLRIINAAVDRIFTTSIVGIDGMIVAADGMPLPAPHALDTPMIAPAQRIDVIGDVTDTVALALEHRGGSYALGTLEVDGSVPRRDTEIAALPAHGVMLPGVPTQELTLRMQGGAMSAGHGGDDIWAFNDHSGMSDEPFARIRQGETVKFKLVNDSRFPHGIHLHGHHFYELDETGALGDFRDTTLILGGESRDILCRFDNPGRWMLHCHMLSHQFGGMKTWLEVA